MQYHTDPVGQLIMRLHTVRDDLVFLNKIGEVPDVNTYGNVGEEIRKLIFTTEGVFTRHIDRVEDAGIIIAKHADGALVFFPMSGKSIIFPLASTEE